MKSITKEHFSDRPQWQKNYILSNIKDDLKAIWGFTILWGIVCLPFIWHLPELLKRDMTNVFILSPFLIIAFYLLYTAITRTQKARQLGDTALVMQPFPGVIGAEVGGTILLNTPYTDKTECKVKLQSVYKYKVKRIHKKFFRHKIQWHKETKAQVTATTGGIKLQFNVNVPKGLKNSEKPSDKYYYWILKLKLIDDNESIERNYEIPMFNIPELATAEINSNILNARETKNDRPETSP